MFTALFVDEVTVRLLPYNVFTDTQRINGLCILKSDQGNKPPRQNYVSF